MKDTLLKRIELWFRRLLILLLGCIFRRKHELPNNVDFNTCKFLFIRQDLIGDVLISTPLFAVLKKHYPDAIIDVLLSVKNQFVLENDPLIRKRWVYNKKLRDVISIINSVRNEHYDFAIDLMDNPSTTSTIFCLLANAKWNIGIAKDNSYAYDITVPMLSRQNTHIIDRIAQLLTPFGINPAVEKLSVRYFPRHESENYAEQFLKKNNLQNYPIIGVNISAGGNVRFWGIENFKKLLNIIHDSYPEYKVLLLYKPADEKRAQMIVESNNDVIISPVTSSFDQFASLVKRTSLLITPDTSAVHLASAFGISALVLYVQSDKTLRIWEPYNIDYEALITDVDDLSTISVASVKDSLAKLIARQRNKKHSLKND